MLARPEPASAVEELSASDWWTYCAIGSSVAVGGVLSIFVVTSEEVPTLPTLSVATARRS